MSREIDWAQVPIGEIALDAPVRVSSSATLREAAALMRDRAASCVLVGTGHRSILTEHDLAAALVARMGPEALVEKVASPEPVWRRSRTSTGETGVMSQVDRVLRPWCRPGTSWDDPSLPANTGGSVD